MFQRREKQKITTRAANWIWPRSGMRRSSRYIWHRVARISGSPHFIAAGVVAGVFASWTPFIGFHFILAAMFAYFLRGSLLASAIGTFFGNPISFPFIWIATYNVGAFLMGLEARSDIDLTMPDGTFALLFSHPSQFFETLWRVVGPVFWPMLIGSLPLGFGTAIPMYFLLRPFIARYKGKRTERLAETAANRRNGAQNDVGA